jgi:hypothetical protein
MRTVRGSDTILSEDEIGLNGWVEVLDLFLAQDRFDSFDDYLFDLKLAKRGQIIIEALEALGVTREQIAIQLTTSASASDSELITRAGAAFTELPMRVWISYAQQYAQNVYSNFFGLKYLSGKSEDDIDVLIDLLASRGPVVVTGSLGFSFYASEPKKLDEKYGLRHVYGWPVGSVKGKASQFFHCVTLVGALKKETKGYVYFLDPQDVSDPSHPELERVFKISYATFINCLRSVQSNEGLSGKVPLARVWNIPSLKVLGS